MNEAIAWIKDNPWAATIFGGALMVLILTTISKGVRRIFSKLWSRFKLLWDMRRATWIPSDNNVHVRPTRIFFQEPGSVRYHVPIDIGFEITGKVKLIHRVFSTGGPSPDFRINLRPKVDDFPYCFVICPWEDSEKFGKYFQCHMNWTPGPIEGSGPRLRAFELCPAKKLPFSFSFTLRFTSQELYFKCSLGDRVEFSIPIHELQNYPLKPQYIGFYAVNSATRITKIRIKRIG